MDMMKAFICKGHTVVAAAQENEKEWSEQFKAEGIEYRQIFVQRNGVNPLNDLRSPVSYTHLDVYKRQNGYGRGE